MRTLRPMTRRAAGVATLMLGLVALTLALPAAVMAERCDASHIVMTKTFPSGPVNENQAGGAIIQFGLEGCDNPGSTVTPRDYPIPFCAEIFDSTPCNANARDCLANNVAGARGVLVVTGIERVGEFKVCAYIAETDSRQSLIVFPYNNNFVDVRQNAIFAIMRHPTRHLHIPIQDDD